jgi:NAD(P)H-flavin reductase
MIYAFGIGEVPLSISGSPRQRDCLMVTVRAVGAVTEALARARRGAAVGVRGPFGRGWATEEVGDRHVVAVAGGAGLVALYPALLDLLRRRRSRLTVVVGARTPADLIFRDRLVRWAERPGVNVEITVERATSGWAGHVGLVTERLAATTFAPAQTAALVCGPEVMMRLTAAQLASRGVAPRAIQLSLERNMQCGEAWCGHCQLGPLLLCRDGPVVTWERAAALLRVEEL